MRVFVLLAGIFLCCSTAVFSQHDLAVTALGEYFELLETGNFETAEMMWLESAQERSRRFGITYTNIPLKIDCGSPIIRDLDRFRDRLNPPAQRYDDLAKSNFGKATYSVVMGNELVEYDYYLANNNKYFWLAYPQDYYARHWPLQETRFFRIHVNPNQQSYLHNVKMDRADELLLDLAKKLELSQASIDEIEKLKIEYFYCFTADDVDSMIGHQVAGSVDLASNDVISKEFPHLHELVHLLVNIRLKDIPLFTLPLMREGVAVYYGGRWGKDVGTLLELAAFLQGQKFVELDSILTMYNFNNYGSTDIAYPLTGLFTAYLIDNIGTEKYFELYRSLSGDFKTVSSLTRDAVRSILKKTLNKSDWQTLLDDFNNYSNEVLSDFTTAQPGESKGKIVSGANKKFEVREDDEWVGFSFDISQLDNNTGTLLIKPDSQLFGMRSSLFEEHFKNGEQYPGYHFAVRYDLNEAGLYDYVSNLLLGKFILGFKPTDNYIHEDTHKITIQFRRSLFDNQQLTENDFKLIEK